VFKFKKYKEGYEDGKRGVSPRYSLDIGSFLRGEGQYPPEISATQATEVETSLDALSRNITPLTSSFLLSALDAGRVAGISSATVEETSLNNPSSDAAPLVMSPPSAVSDARQVARAAPEEAALPASTPKASHNGKDKLSDREFALFNFFIVVCKDFVYNLLKEHSWIFSFRPLLNILFPLCSMF